MKNIAVSMLIFILVAVVIILVNIAGTALIEITIPSGLSEDRVPLTGPAQSLLLIVGFVAGAAGAILVVFLAPMRATLQALVYLVIILLLDIAAAAAWWNLVPAWFAIAMVVLAPLQVWAGTIIGMRLRGGRLSTSSQSFG